MKVMVIVKASQSSEEGRLPSEALLTAMGNFNEALVNARIMASGDGLRPSCDGYRVRFSGEDRQVIKGPFEQTNELIAGYWVWNVQSMDEALEWVKKCPNPMEEDSDIEIRPFYTMEDFAEIDSSDKVAEQESNLRNTIALQNTQVNQYLFFSGQCEQALAFYQKTLGAQVTTLLRFNESPSPLPEDQLPKGFENKVMHCEFTIGNTTVFASDGCGTSESMQGFSIALTLQDAELAQQVFNGLARGGEVLMPLAEVFWSPLYGQVVDPFGVQWMVMLPAK